MNPIDRDEIAKIFRKWLKEEISGEEVSAIDVLFNSWRE